MTISNNDLKKYSSLNRKNKRKEHQLFVVEGEKICKELIKTDFEYESIFTTKDIQNKFPLSTVCSKKEIERISHLKSPCNVVAICKIPVFKINIKDKKQLIFLDNITRAVVVCWQASLIRSNTRHQEVLGSISRPTPRSHFPSRNAWELVARYQRRRI